jgi:hypothetical protein
MMRHPAVFAAAPLLALAIACGSDASGPVIGPASIVSVTASPTATGAVNTAIGNFSVKVADANGNGVAGTVVSFSATGVGASFSASTATADASGIATTTVTLGSKTGVTQLAARAAGVTAPATVSVTATPGPLFTLETTPKSLRFFSVGDTARITFALADEFSNVITDTPLAFAVSDPTLVKVDPQGLVTALRGGGTATITISASGRSDSAKVRVLGENESPCVDLATSSPIAVGQVVSTSSIYTCLPSVAGAAAEYTLVAHNSSLDGATLLPSRVTAWGLATPPSALKAPSASRPMLSRSVSGFASASAPVLDQGFHQRLLTQSRSLSRLFGFARSARNARLSASRPSAGRLAPSASPSFSAIPSTVSVGDIVRLNVSSSPCDAAIIRGFRVTAIGAKSIVLADTLNPANGFSDAEYVKFAARFDTLVYPLDVDNFGAPSDLDGNGKVAVLFTKYVNELTPANSDSFIGGFFHPRDLFPKADTDGLQGCPSSNEGEMFYMLVPDPTGVVNGNKYSLGFVDTLTVGVLAHEFQHLINAGRRIYVNVGAVDFEDTWLNEGLSHIAEELLYYRESGMQPRQGLTDALIRANASKYAMWKADASSNFSRLLEYIEHPGASSPIDAENDELSTRGASWSFLRYAVDRAFTSDAGVWSRFSNSTETGLKTVTLGLQTDPRPYLADFAIATYLSDLGVSTDPRFRHKSWNYRDIFSNTFGTRVNGVFTPNGFYPLETTGLADRVTTTVNVRGGSASYLRLTVPAGREALVSHAEGTGTTNTSFVFSVIRTK